MARFYGLFPLLLLLVNTSQVFKCLNLVARPLRESCEQFCRAVEKSGSQIVLRQREQRLVPLLGGEIGPRNNVLVNTDCAIHLAPAPEQATQRKVGLDGLVVDPHHFQKVFESLVCLLIEEKIEAFQIVDIERRRWILHIALAPASQRPTGGGQQQEQPCKQKGGFSRHRSMADF